MEDWRRNLYILWGTQFLAMVGMNLIVPFLPFFIRQLGVTDEQDLAQWSGLVFSGPFFVSFIATPFWGTLGDRYGRKAMVVRAIFGLALSQAFMGFSQNVYQLLAFRILQGGISGFIAATLALVSTNTPKERIGYALGFMQSASAGGMVIGPFVGGLLADLIGYREIFFVTAVICAVSGIVVLMKVEDAPLLQQGGRVYTVRQNYRLMYTDKRLRIVGLALIIGQMSILMIEPIFALFVESFKTDTKYISTITGSIFSVSGVFMVIAAPWWGRRNDRKGYKRNLYTAMAAVGIVYAGHIIVTDLIQLAVLRAFLGFVLGGVLPTLYSLTNLYSPPERRGGMIAIASSMTVIGNLFGPVLGGFLAGNFGITTSFVVNSCMLVAMSYIIWKYLADEPQKATPVLQTVDSLTS